MRRPLLLIVGLGPLLGACLDDHMAEDCRNTYTCPFPDAGDESTPGCPGQCVPLGYAGWDGPYLVWVDAGPPPPTCPDHTRSFYEGVAPPAAPACGACTCQPSTGSCTPAAVTTHADQCPGTGSGAAFDPPSAWDGGCTTPDEIAGGVASIAVAPLVPTEGCAAVTAPTGPLPPQPAAIVHGCFGLPRGTCSADSECLPLARDWVYCISHEGAGDVFTAHCPPDSPYTDLRVFAERFTEPACSPCTCASPEGSDCGESLVTFYADDACSDPVGSVEAVSSGPMCVDIPSSSPLESMSATPGTYTPGTCKPSGGSPLAASPVGPTTFCCLPTPPTQ